MKLDDKLKNLKKRFGNVQLETLDGVSKWYCSVNVDTDERGFFQVKRTGAGTTPRKAIIELNKYLHANNIS